MKPPSSLTLIVRSTKEEIGWLDADGYVTLKAQPQPKTMSSQDLRRLIWQAQSVGVPPPPSGDLVVAEQRRRGLRPPLPRSSRAVGEEFP